MSAQFSARLLLGLLVLLLAAGYATASAADPADVGQPIDPEAQPTNTGADLLYTLITAVVGLVLGFLIAATMGTFRRSPHRHHHRHRTETGWNRISERVAATMSRMGTFLRSSRRHHHRHRTEAGWNRISERIQAGTSQGLAEWRSAENPKDANWDDLSRRIRQHILEEMRKHPD